MDLAKRHPAHADSHTRCKAEFSRGSKQAELGDIDDPEAYEEAKPIFKTKKFWVSFTPDYYSQHNDIV